MLPFSGMLSMHRRAQFFCETPASVHLLHFFFNAYPHQPSMLDSTKSTMTMSSFETNKSPLTFDHDSEKLTIISGTFATLLALFGLVFAALTWYTPRRRPSTQPSASSGHDLESNEPRNATPMVQDPPDTVNTNSEYVKTRFLPDVHKLTSSSNARAAPSSLAIDLSSNNVDTIVPMALQQHPSIHVHCELPGELPHRGSSLQ
jgi:hypothetical protein